MRLKKRSLPRPGMVQALKPWLLAVGMVVSFTATAGIRTSADPATPALRFADDPALVSLAWPTLTAPDIAAAEEDFIAARPALASVDDVSEPETEPQLQPGFWRGAQPTDGTDDLSGATPEISVLFRLNGAMLPEARAFDADDGGLIIGAFSNQYPNPPERVTSEASVPKAPDTIVIARIAPASVIPSVNREQSAARAALVPARPVPPRSPLVGTVTSEREMKCLAEAVYFEARSEPERGQAGVAQVVLNRSRSGVYPSTVCGVVYQNRHRYLACQFTFACEGKSLRITEPGPWSTAMRIARDVAEGRTYLPGVGNATHYHANYVRPWWARHMDRREKVGKHIFYFETAEN
jgi:hypothetical protein